MALTRDLVRAARQWRRLAGSTAKAFGMSEATLYPLVTLGRMNASVRQSTLADALGIEGPSLVRLIDQLEEADLVTRTSDASDRRAKLITLTDAGEERVAAIELDLARLRRETFKGASDDDLAATERVFDSLQRALVRREIGGPSR